MKKFLIGLFIGISIVGSGWYLSTKIFKKEITVGALSVYQVFQGGTGATTLTGCLTGNGTSPFTGSGSPCGSGGSGGTFSTSTISGYAGVLNNYSNNATDVVEIGGTSGTSTAKVYFDPNGQKYQIGNSATASTTIAGKVQVTGTATSTFVGPVSIAGYSIATTSTVCIAPEHCTFQVTSNGATAASQFKAAADILSAMGGGNLLIKRGNYSPSAITRIQSNIHIICEAGAVINSANAGVFNLYRGTGQSIVDCSFDGVTMTNSALNSNYTILVEDSTNFLIDHNTMTNLMGFGMYIISSQTPAAGGGTSYGTVSRNYMVGMGNQDIIGGGQLFSTSATTSDIKIVGNTLIQQIQSGRTTPGVDLDLNCYDMVQAIRIQVQNNNCRGNIVYGFEKYPNSFDIVSGNIMDEPIPLGTVRAAGTMELVGNAIPSSNATSTPMDLLVTGNNLNNGAIIVVGDSDNPMQNVSLTTNTIRSAPSTYISSYDLGRNGIFVTYISKSKIHGNIIIGQDPTQTGVVLDNSTYVDVAANTIQDFAIGVNLGNGTGNKSTFNDYYNVTTPTANGNNLVSMNNLGQVGIGTDVVNANPKFQVGQTISGQTRVAYFGDSTNPNTNALVVGYDGINNAGWIGSITENVAWRNLILNPNGGNLAVGTSSALWLTDLFSSTAPQLALSAGAGIPQWTFRNAGGSLFLSTTTIAGSATTSISALSIDGSTGNAVFTTTVKAAAGQNNGIAFAVGDDTTINDINVANTLGVNGVQDSTTGGIKLGSGGPTIFGKSSNFGIGSTTPWKQLSVGSNNIGTIAISTTTDGCVQSTKGEFWINTCGSGGGSGTVSSGLAGQLGYYNSSGTTLVGTSTNPLYVSAIYATSTTDNATSTILGTLTLGAATTASRDNVLSVQTSRTYTTSGTAQADAGAVNFNCTNNIRECQEWYTTTAVSAPSILRLENLNSAQTAIGFKIKTNSTSFAGNLGISIQGKQSPAIELNEDQWNGGLNNQGQGLFQIASHQHNNTPAFSIDSRNNTNNAYCSDFLMSSNFASTTFGRLTLFNCTDPTGTSSEGSGRFNLFGTSTTANLANFTSVQGATQGDIVVIKQAGNVGIGSSTPFAKLSIGSVAGDQAFFVGSSTATLFSLNKIGNLHLGYAKSTFGCDNGLPDGCMEIVGNSNSINGGGQLELQNINSGTSAYTGLFLANDLANGVVTNYSGLFLNSSKYTDTTFGTANAVKSLLALQNTMGSISLQASTTLDSGAYINFLVGGNNTGNEFGRFSDVGLKIGTTTGSIAPLIVSSSTAPQVSLSAGLGINQITFRNAGGNLYISTTTVAGTATTSTAALSIIGSGKPGIAISSSTPFATLSVNPLPGDFSAQFAIGSSSGYSFLVDNSGHIFIPNTTTNGAAQTGTLCYSSTNEVVRDTAVCAVSALKFKKDVTNLDVGLADLLTLRPVSYYKKEPLDETDSHRQMGLIADEVASNPKLNEMLVTYDSNGDIHGFRYDQFTALLTKSIQELNQKVTDLSIGKIAHSAEDKWQDILIGLLIIYVIWNEYDKRHR